MVATESHRRGIAEIAELTLPGDARRCFELRWVELDSNEEEVVAVIGTDRATDPAAALRWARERADVVVVQRPATNGYMTAYSAGVRRPADSPEMPPLDEEQMLTGSPAAASPAKGGIDDVGGVVAWPRAPRAATPDRSAAGAASVSGAPQRRLESALDSLQASEVPVSLANFRALLGRHGLVAGENELGSDPVAAGGALIAVFDRDDAEELAHYLLLEADGDEAITDIHLVRFGRHLRVGRRLRST